MEFNPDTWGTVADWVGGLGTTAAFGVAAYVLALDLRQRKRAQAEAISYHYQIADFTELVFNDYRYLVRNDSGLPVHGVRLFDKANPLVSTIAPQGPLLPGETWTHRTTTWDRYTMPSLAFVDSAGRKWTKDIGGRVREGWPWQTKKELKAWDKKVQEAEAEAKAAAKNRIK